MRLGIAAVSTYVPPDLRHTNLLGPVIHTAYGHLFEAAGVHSRAPTVRRGVITIPSEPFLAPTAASAECTSDLASKVVGQMMATITTATSRVRKIIHTQCTLDQQILGSVCLRVEHDHYGNADSSITIGQLGTAGVPTALRLAAAAACDGRGLICVSACDKWVSPFFRRIPGLAVFGDAAGSCLLESEEPTFEPIATIEEIVTSCRPPGCDIWTAPPEQIRANVYEHARECLSQLLSSHPGVDRASLAIGGDGYGEDFLNRLARGLEIQGERVENPSPDIHYSSASPLIALKQAIAVAVKSRKEIHAAIWTATLDGHAGALLARCSPRAAAVSGGWSSRDLC